LIIPWIARDLGLAPVRGMNRLLTDAARWWAWLQPRTHDSFGFLVLHCERRSHISTDCDLLRPLESVFFC
jgi:hypothetical protein